MVTNHPSLRQFRLLSWACAALALVVAAASLVGVLSRDGSATRTTLTVRGESVEWLTTGPYAFNATRTVAEAVGWDWVTLVLAAPSLLAASVAVRRGSVRGRLLAAGLTAYVFYQYLQYATVFAFGPLFPVFVLIYPSALGITVALVWGLAAAVSQRSWPSAFPRRGLAVLCFAVAALLVLLWSSRIAQGLAGGLQGILLGQTTLVVQALDLGLVVPFAVFVGVLSWRARPLALVWGPLLLGKAVFMALAILAMLLIAWGTEGHLEVVPFVLFSLVAAASLVLGWKTLRCL